jgi:hypothetical protein
MAESSDIECFERLDAPLVNSVEELVEYPFSVPSVVACLVGLWLWRAGSRRVGNRGAFPGFRQEKGYLSGGHVSCFTEGRWTGNSTRVNHEQIRFTSILAGSHVLEFQTSISWLYTI